MSARIQPAPPPYPAEIQAVMDRLPRAWNPPFRFFTTMARDPRLFGRITSGALIDKGHLTLRQREIVIDRVTAQCKNEYEWGLHVNLYAEKAKLTDAQVRATVHAGPDDPCWDATDRLLIRLCDELHATCDVSYGLWTDLRAVFGEEAIMELLMLAGYYRMNSYLCRGLRFPLEPGGRAFPEQERP
jgi:Carboxymuconolactone decarboxylase family